MKKSLLIIGAFNNNNNIRGGIKTSCDALLNSKIKDEFELILLDSTQISNPAPNFFIRILFSVSRFLKLIFILLANRPSYALIFTADGPSFIEKSIFGNLCSAIGCSTFIFPRAGNLITQINKSVMFAFLCRILSRRNKFFLCQGPSWVKFANKDLGYDLDHIYVLPNWTAKIESFNQSKMKIDFHAATLKIIFVGWLERTKGVYELMHAFNALVMKGYNVELSYIGGGKELDSLQQLAKKLNISQKIYFHGWLDRENLFSILNKHQLFVLPSWSEGMSNAVIEALSHGLTVITTRVGVMPDFFEDKKNVLFVDHGDIKDLTNALETLYIDRYTLENIANEGKFLAQNLFNPDKIITELINIIKQ